MSGLSSIQWRLFFRGNTDLSINLCGFIFENSHEISYVAIAIMLWVILFSLSLASTMGFNAFSARFQDKSNVWHPWGVAIMQTPLLMYDNADNKFYLGLTSHPFLNHIFWTSSVWYAGDLATQQTSRLEGFKTSCNQRRKYIHTIFYYLELLFILLSSHSYYNTDMLFILIDLIVESSMTILSAYTCVCSTPHMLAVLFINTPRVTSLALGIFLPWFQQPVM